MMKTTFRIIDLDDPATNVGLTAATRELAMRSPGRLFRDGNTRLAIEQTEWIDRGDRWTVTRSVVVDAEATPGLWKIGAEAAAA